MQTKTLVQATANIVTIVNLAEGDVYKRITKSDYERDYKMFMGVVTSVMHNGEEAAITAIEFEEEYSRVNVKNKIFAADSEMQLYSTTPEEVSAHLGTLAKLAREDVKRKATELADAEGVVQRIARIDQMAGAGQLKAATTGTPKTLDAATADVETE